MNHKKKYIAFSAALLALVLSSCSVAKHDLSDGWIDLIAQEGEPPPPVIRFSKEDRVIEGDLFG